MTTPDNQICSSTESPTISTRTDNHNRRKSQLERSKPCCENGKMTMCQLLNMCQNDPDYLIEIYRISTADEKCLPYIDLDEGEHDKYHHLMADDATSVGHLVERSEDLQNEHQVLKKKLPIHTNGLDGNRKDYMQEVGGRYTSEALVDESGRVGYEQLDTVKGNVRIRTDGITEKILQRESVIAQLSEIKSLFRKIYQLQEGIRAKYGEWLIICVAY